MALPMLDQKLLAIRKLGLVIGVIGTLICAFGFFVMPHHFASSYLLAFLYWTGVILGSLPVLMVHNLTGGNWGYPIRRILGTTARLIPWLLLFFVPLLFCLGRLYPWMDPQVVQHDSLLQDKAFYLNPSFFTFRTVFYFLTWSFLAYAVTQDFKLHPALRDRKSQASGLGLIFYVLTVTFFSIDWAMSLEPHWNSTIYGFIFLIGQTLSGFAFATLTALVLRKSEPLSKTLTEDRRHDLGTLLFVFIMLWAYMSLSQFLIIWSGNLPETTPWYIRRFHGGWQIHSIFNVLFHFFVPFFFLLMKAVKRNPRTLMAIAALLLFMRWVDLFWYIKPVFSETWTLHFLDVAALAAIGGWFVVLLTSRLRKIDLVLAGDPAAQKGAAS